MAESEEFRLKRLQHEERLSRVFDEVMGLGEFADSSGGSASSSRSGGQEETKGVDETSRQGEHQPMEEDDSNSSRQEEKTKERTGESLLAQTSTPASDRPPSFTLTANEGGGSGGAAFDNALDGLPSFEPNEEDEDWHYSLPMDSKGDANAARENTKGKQPGSTNSVTQDNPFDVQPREEEEEQEREGTSGSANTSHSSQDPTPENSRDGGALNQTEETEDSQQGEQSETVPMEDSNPPMSPVNIKDEPIDEGYDAALMPQSSIRHIKEELDPQQEEELRISSVYSVGGGNAFTAPPMPAPVQAHPPAAIFIQGRGAVLQAMAPLPVRPPAPVPTSLPALTAMPPRQPQPPPVPGSVRCSGCSKVLLKGQTAFQRKGSTQLFCSTVCLTGHLPPTTKNRCCFQCNREIIQPRDMIMFPADDSTLMHFCGQFCLSVYKHKRKQVEGKVPDKTDKRTERKVEKPPEKPAEVKPFCSVCKVSNKIEHEVTHQGRLHSLCSDACFVSWRKMRQLAMNCCEGCGLYCNSKSGSCQTLMIDRSQLNFCGPTCICTYKQTCRKSVDCAYCHKMAIVSSTIMERDQKGKVQLYCSSNCVERSRPPRHMLSGTAFPCCQCKQSAVPQYHLAMVDGTIRNFCSYECVSTFRKTGQISQPDGINGNSSLREPSLREAPKPGPSVGASSVPLIPQDYPSSVPHPGHHPSQTSVPPLVPSCPPMSSPSIPGQAQARAPTSQLSKPTEVEDITKLTCHQCNKKFNTKPRLFSYQGHISMFCSRTCSDQYKTQKNILILCEWCKQEKVVYDIISYNQQEVSFCSESCGLYFKSDMQSRNKDHPWRPCTYCSGISHKMLHSHYGGRMEEFCRPHCMSQYTVLYYGMGRCDSCRKQGYINEKLQCLGSVRNFCNLPCLLQYCYVHFEPSQHSSSNGTETAAPTPYAPTQPHHSSKMNPVIADVVSLANGSASQPNVTADIALTGALPASNVDGKNLDHASTQTDAMRVPGPRRRQMKNKSVLCRPFTMDQESMCQLPTQSTESSAVSIITPVLRDSSSQPDPPSAEASASPAPSPKSQGESQPCDGVPARLTGRHFLGLRETDAYCKVCSQHKRKWVEEEEEKQERKKKTKTEEEEEAEEEEEEVEGKVGEETKADEKEVNTSDDNDGQGKVEEKCEMKTCEQKSEKLGRKTSYYCKTCSGEPSLCPVPCFELFHTRLIYKTATELETLALPSVSSSTGEENVKVIMVPVPVPVYIPVPMNMYSQHTPVPMAMPVPIPVPLMVQQNKELKDAAVQSEPLTEMEEIRKDVPVSSADQVISYHGNAKLELVTPLPLCEEETEKGVQAELPPADSSATSTETILPHHYTDPEEGNPTSQAPSTSTEHQPPSSPMMDLESDLPSDFADQKSSAPQRGVKRQREGFSGRKRSRRRTAPVTPAASKLNHMYGVKAWRSWVQERNKQLSKSNIVDIKEDVIQCDSAELSFALSRFVKEVRRPNGEPYRPDSIFYLCLGIQQYLFMKGRIENIFTDQLYIQFATEISAMLNLWKPKLVPGGGLVPSRVAESYLWECKQLGAYSPIVLLNTLLFFCTKNFHFTTVAQHKSLAFTNFTRCSKPCSRAGNVHYLRYQRSSTVLPRREETERLRKKQVEVKEDLEMLENVPDPLHCPVRLYEFYLSRCPVSVQKRDDVFYLQPEQNVHNNSSHWYTPQPLEDSTLQIMLTRILAVKEVHQELPDVSLQ